MTGPPERTPVPICGSVTGATNQESLDHDREYSRRSDVAQVRALDFRLTHACQSLHALGPRALCEFIQEVEGRYPGTREFIRDRLAIYNRMDLADIESLTNSGGFPPPPIYRVPEG